MEENTDTNKLIQSNLILVETNKKLVKANRKAINLIRAELAENEDTLDYLKQEYQALADKKERSIQEEIQYLYLKKKLTGR